MTVIYLDQTGGNAVVTALQQATAKLQDPTDLYRQVGAKLQNNIEDRFVSKTDPAGDPWAPFKAVSLAIYRSRNAKVNAKGKRIVKDPPGSLMDRSGYLKESATYNVSPAGLEVGLSDYKAVFHEFGTRSEFNPGAIPRRGMVFGKVSGHGRSAEVVDALGAGDEADVLAIIQQYVHGSLNGV